MLLLGKNPAQFVFSGQQADQLFFRWLQMKLLVEFGKFPRDLPAT